MLFIETSVFTRTVEELMPRDEYRALQSALVLRPELGTLIPGSGGLRKVRWHVKGRGKRGGLRVIYYLDKKNDTLYMLLVYRKSRQEDLTPQQVKILSRLVQGELK